MERKTQPNCLPKHKKRKKKNPNFNSEDSQVTFNVVNQHFFESNFISNLSNDDIDQNNENFTNILSSASNDLSESPQNDISNMNEMTVTVDKDKRKKRKKIKNSHVKKNNQENILKNENLIQFKKSDNTNQIQRRFINRKIHNENSIHMDHTYKYKTVNKSNLNYVHKFHCFTCDTIVKLLTDWKLHVTSTDHIDKCINGNDYVSYECGKCKTLFFGDKELILNHCRDFHKDSSRLPCIFKCMKDVLKQFMFIDPGNQSSWSFCGLCKKYALFKIKCSPLINHVNKKFKKLKCNSCLIDFKCSEDLYNKHLISCEHIMLEYFRAEVNKKLEISLECNLKLPPIFFIRFSVDNEKAICNNCKCQLLSTEESITTHLKKCNLKLDLSEKSTIQIKNYFCEVCNKIVSDFNQWKSHLISSSHLINCNSIDNLVSYTCEICLLHCYGGVHHVIKHQDIHSNVSEEKLSKFLAFNFQRINKNVKSKNYFYCEDCETYDEVNCNSGHWNKSHKTKLKRMICQPCCIEFFCIEGNYLFDKHTLSCEHIILSYIATKNPFLEFVTPSSAKTHKLCFSNDQDKISCNLKGTLKEIKKEDSFNINSYLNWFQNDNDNNKLTCVLCNHLTDINENALLSHLLMCDKNITKNKPETNINNFQCLECSFHCNIYDMWKKHAMSHFKLNTFYNLYSYFCKHCDSLLYGKTNEIELHLNNEHTINVLNLPLETVLLMKQLMRKYNNENKYLDIMSICESCNKIFKVTENYNHFNTDSHVLVSSDLIELFYCKYCEIEFYSSSKFYECHKLTAEHIILSSEYNNIDLKILPKPLKLDTQLIKFVTNEKLYNKTKNISFFCFVCNYLCLSLNTWKNHINNKNHITSIKNLFMDHRCKICKTLMFGQRQQIFDHYSNLFHSMLRQFKLNTSTIVLKNNSLLLQNYETKYEKNNYELNKTTTINKNMILNEFTNPNEIDSLTKMMNELSHQPNTQNFSIYGKSTTHNNEIHSIVKTTNDFSLKSNTICYSRFYREKIKMINQNKNIKSPFVYYCEPCDFITELQNAIDNHEKSYHLNDMNLRHKVFCDICNLCQVGLSDNLKEHIETIEHKNMVDCQKLYDSNNMKNMNNKTQEKVESNINLILDKTSDVNTTQIKKEENNKKEENDKKETTNGRLMIEIKDAKYYYKKNNWVETKKIFSTYGHFGTQIKTNSFIIVYRKLHFFNLMLKDKEKLEKDHKFTICVLNDDSERSEE